MLYQVFPRTAPRWCARWWQRWRTSCFWPSSSSCCWSASRFSSVSCTCLSPSSASRSSCRSLGVSRLPFELYSIVFMLCSSHGKNIVVKYDVWVSHPSLVLDTAMPILYIFYWYNYILGFDNFKCLLYIYIEYVWCWCFFHFTPSGWHLCEFKWTRIKQRFIVANVFQSSPLPSLVLPSASPRQRVTEMKNCKKCCNCFLM